MTVIFCPNLLPGEEAKRESYSALIIDPSDGPNKSISPDPDGCYQIDSGTTVLFRRIGGHFAKFHVEDDGTSAQIKSEMLVDGHKKKNRWSFAAGDNFIGELGVFHMSQGNKETG